MRPLATAALVLLLAACSAGQAGSTTTQAPGTTQDDESSGTEGQGGGPSYDLTGGWHGELTQVSASGICGAMPGQQGTVSIQQAESTFTMDFAEGFQCNPPEACGFTGTIDGTTLQASNDGPADSEGGIYLSTFRLAVDDADHIHGSGESRYTLADVVCVWDTALVLTRAGG